MTLQAKDEKPYWHEVSDDEAKDVLGKSITVGEFMAKFRQPDWCDYPDALSGPMGCWTLVDLKLRKHISEDFCKGCDSCKLKEARDGRDDKQHGA